jgi:hypothetical protein
MKKLLIFLALALCLQAAPPAYVVVGGKVTISVAADGTQPFTYQWKKDGVNITGASASTYVIASAKVTDAGNYTVVVSNLAGSTLSDTAPVNIVVVPTNVKTASVVENPPAP